MGFKSDLTGQKFGRLTVVAYDHSEKGRGSFWRCDCECGACCVKQRSAMVKGLTKSCGCLAREICPKAPLKHGMTGTREYRIYHNMIQRCTNPKQDTWDCYHSRGITVDSRWLGSGGFERFLKDMGPCPFANASIDRIDNDIGYSPTNCRWSTPEQQSNNRRSNIWIEYKGERKTLAQWCRLFNITRNALRYRLKAGWSVEEALTTPVRERN